MGTAAAAKSYADLTAVGVAASTLLVVDVESESCTAPTTAVVAAAMLMAGVAPPDDAIGAVPVTEVTAAAARSYADFTEFGVAAVVMEVDEVESVSCTAPLTAVVASAIEMAGVVPPDEAIGDVPVTEATLVPARS